MNQRLKRLGIILSVVFNLTAIAGFIYAVYFATPGAGSGPIPSLYRNVNLTVEQQQRLNQMMAEPRRHMIEVRRQSRERWNEITVLLAQPQTDWQAIRAKHEEKLDLQREYEATLFRAWVDSMEILTPEQRQRFFEIVQQEIKSGTLFNRQPQPSQ